MNLRTVFLTGGTGFVGSHTARLFLREGWRVRALVRRPDKPGLLPDGVDVVVGNLDSVSAYRGAMEGVDAVMHVAGAVKAVSYADYVRANADGAESVARTAALACPDAMFVLVSSLAAAGPSRDGRALSVDCLPKPVSLYGKSKLEGEQRVTSVLQGPWAIIRPTVVYGDGDPGVLELFKAVQLGFAPIVAGGRTPVQLIAVQDLARVLVAISTRMDLAGKSYFAGNETVSTGELSRFIGSLRRPKAWNVLVPAMVIRLAAAAESLREHLTGKPRPFNRDKATEMLQPAWLGDVEPLWNTMALRDRLSWKDGFRQLALSYVNRGWLQAGRWAV